MPNFAAFATYVLVTTFTPGPNNIMSMSGANRVGFKRNLPFCIGVGAGFSMLLMLAALFSGLLYAAIPNIKPFMLALGAAYMLYLAYKTWKNAQHPHSEQEKSYTGFAWGAALQFVNPKAIFYAITVMSSYVLPSYQDTATLALISVGLGAISIISNISWSLFGLAFKAAFATHAKLAGGIMAALLVYSAVSLFL